MDDLGRRFVACFVQAMDDAGLPEDAAFRAEMRAFIEWSVREFLAFAPHGSRVPFGLPLPLWPQAGA